MNAILYWVLKTGYTTGPRWFLDKRRASSRLMSFPTIVPMRGTLTSFTWLTSSTDETETDFGST
jgi:hypothetical protein